MINHSKTTENLFHVEKIFVIHRQISTHELYVRTGNLEKFGSRSPMKATLCLYKRQGT